MPPKRNTRDHILQTVIRLLTEGKAHLSMAQIAKESDISKSALYYFFENKKELFQEVILFIFGHLIQKIEQISAQDLPPRQKLQSMMQECTNCAEKENSVTHFIFQQVFENDQEMIEKMTSMREQLKSFFSHVLQQGQEKESFRSFHIEKTAEIMVGYIDFIALRSALPQSKNHPPIPTAQLCDHLLDFLLP